MSLHKTKEVKVWIVQKFVFENTFFGRWEWVEDSTSKGAATKRAKKLQKETKISHRSTFTIKLVKITE